MSDPTTAAASTSPPGIMTSPVDQPGHPDPNDFLPDLEPVQLIAPDGTFTEHPEHPVGLSDDQLRDLYRQMVITRRVDREAINLQRQGQLGLHASCMGQEAAQVGSAFALEENDWVFPSYREMGSAVVKNVDLGNLLHIWRGTWLSNHDPYEHNYALMAIPIGTQALHAVGFAMGAKLEDNPLVVMTYFGDGATSEGDPHEAMNFAGVYDSPVVFFIQNNQWAISVPLSAQTAAPTLAHKAVGYGFPGYRCDGNDVLASYVVSRKAVDRARRGDGPSLIEAMTYRMEAHTTSDDTTRYRTAEAEAAAAEADPLVRYKLFLEKESLWIDGFAEEIQAQSDAEATRMRDEIYEAPHGDPMELFEHVYVDSTGHFERDKALMKSELAHLAEQEG